MSLNVLQVASGLSGFVGAYSFSKTDKHSAFAWVHVALTAGYFVSLPVLPAISVIFLFLNFGCWICPDLPLQMLLGSSAFIGLHAAHEGDWALLAVVALYSVVACIFKVKGSPGSISLLFTNSDKDK
jgi:hypothetical protein